MSEVYVQADISGYEYEHICAKILEEKGYKVIEVTKGSHDFGVDVVAKKGGKRYAVQCKYYKDTVKPDAIQQVVAGMRVYDCDSAIVMTNSTFTDAAKELAEINDVILWPRHRVIEKEFAHQQKHTSSTSSRSRRRNASTRQKREMSPALKRGIVWLIVAIVVVICLLIIVFRVPAIRENNIFLNRANNSTAVTTTTGSGYILPDSDSRYYSESELSDLSSDDLRLARNEIYARHGRKFDAEDLQEYFGSQSWYKGTIDPDDFQDSLLNEYEKANVDTIMAVEESK